MSKYILHTVNSKNIYGTMNGGSVRLSNITESDKKMLMENHNLESLEGYTLTKEDKASIFREHRKAFGAAEGFDWHKMFMADQVDFSRAIKNGENHQATYFEITDDYVKANPNGWTDINEDILIITDKVPGVVAGQPVADCPVVMMSDLKQGITAIGHCSAEFIDRKLPMMIADALTEGYGSKEEDIRIFVGACAGEDWPYDKIPPFAKDMQLWKDCIVDDHGIFRIDIRKALRKQFAERGLESNNTLFDLANTRTNPLYYSRSLEAQKPEKYGRHYEGMFYEEVGAQKVRSK